MMYSPGSLAETMVDAVSAGLGPHLGPLVLLALVSFGLVATLRAVVALPDPVARPVRAVAARRPHRR